MTNNRLVIEDLFIFLTSERIAKRVSFTDGINIVTSNQKDGNKVGKSLILKSIYHTLGAESFLDKDMLSGHIVFVVHFSVRGIRYTMLRSDSFFKLFDEKYSLILKTDSSSELASKLYNIFDFSVYLPSRKDNKLSIAPPAYAYMLNYIDQDHMQGSTFSSFDRLGQFTNYKVDLLYCHFGLFNKQYFSLTIKRDKLNDQIKAKEAELNILSGMLKKIQEEIPRAIPEDLEALKIELNRREAEYRAVYSELKKIKDKLTNLRNTQAEILVSLNNVRTHIRSEERDLTKVLKEHNCPLCKQDLKDTLEVRVIKNINIEDLSDATLSLQKLDVKTKRAIQKEENNYKRNLQKLQEYKKILRGSRKNQEEIIQMQGYSDLKTKLDKEWSDEHLKLLKLQDQVKTVDDQLKFYKKKREDVNSDYFVSMKEDKLKFGLVEIRDEQIKNIGKVVRATGSNNPVITIIWYFNLLKLKNKYNPQAIKFPIILDSPNHGELDDDKKGKLFDYLFSNVSDDSQCIISTLGFDEMKIPDKDSINIIKLGNEPYHLLNVKDYENNKDMLELLIQK